MRVGRPGLATVRFGIGLSPIAGSVYPRKKIVPAFCWEDKSPQYCQPKHKILSDGPLSGVHLPMLKAGDASFLPPCQFGVHLLGAVCPARHALISLMQTVSIRAHAPVTLSAAKSLVQQCHSERSEEPDLAIHRRLRLLWMTDKCHSVSVALIFELLRQSVIIPLEQPIDNV